MSSCTIYICHQDTNACIDDLNTRAAQVDLKINTLIRVQPGDQFSKLILGTLNHLRKFTHSPKTARRDVMKHVSGCPVLAGVPNAAGGPLASCKSEVAQIAASMNAMFFDGDTMRDYAGRDPML